MADLGNYTITVSRVRGPGGLEDIDFWNGASAARSSQSAFTPLQSEAR